MYRAPFINHVLHTSIQCSHPIIQSSIYWSCYSFLIPFQLQSLHTDRAPSIHIVLQINQIVLPTMFSTYLHSNAPLIQSFIYPSCFPNNPYIAPNHLLLIPSHTPRLSDISISFLILNYALCEVSLLLIIIYLEFCRLFIFETW